MANLKHLLLDKIGLTTRDRLVREAAVKKRWHSLVRDVFARYYLKLREPFYSYLPPLPHRYTNEWETQMRDDLQEFLDVDLQPVAELLEVCGFGTERWEQLTGNGLGHLEDLIDQHLAGSNGNPAATSADLEAALEEARDEVRKLRIGGRRALARIKGYEDQLVRLETVATADEAVSGEETETSVSPDLLFPQERDESSERIDALQRQLRTREETIDNLRERIEQLQNQSSDSSDSITIEDSQQIDELQRQLRAREETIQNLRNQIEQLQSQPTDGIDSIVIEDSQQIGELQRQLRTREETMDNLRERIEQLQGELDQAPASAEDSLLVDGDLARENAQIRGELRAKDHTIGTLRNQLEELENAMESSRGQLLDQVKKLGDLAAGDVELKPSEELEGMDSEELLEYAQEVAGDLDVRKQTLDEGIEGIETLKNNYEESRGFYEAQQQQFQAQLEEMSAELETYQQQQEEDPEEGDEHADKVIATQRHQLELLKSRITELSNTNKNLTQNNAKMYGDLELAVKRLVPLRQEIENLEKLRDVLCQYIRGKYERTFSLKKLSKSP